MSAAESVWALVSGYPAGARERRCLMVLQICIDDSSQDGECLILAGYISTAENWAKFSTEWAEYLSIRPRWKRFKMSEVMANRPGIETGERVEWLYSLVEKYAQAGICIAVPKAPLVQVVADYGLPKGLENPYYIAWRAIVSICSTWLLELGVRDPVDFIFDKQSEAALILSAWDKLYKSMPERWHQILQNVPIFRRDEDFLPLQAADMLAWWMRKRYIERGTILKDEFPFPWVQRKDGPPMLFSEMKPRQIRKQIKIDLESAYRKHVPTLTLSSSWEVPL